MIKEIISFFSGLIKLAPRYFAVIGIASWAILLTDKTVLSRFGLVDFTENYRPWIAIIGICGVGFIIVDFTAWCWKRLFTLAKHLKLSQHTKQYLRGLTEEEKQILRFYRLQKTRTNSLRPDDGVVNGLEDARIIHTSSVYGSILNGHPFNITRLAGLNGDKCPTRC